MAMSREEVKGRFTRLIDSYLPAHPMHKELRELRDGPMDRLNVLEKVHTEDEKTIAHLQSEVDERDRRLEALGEGDDDETLYAEAQEHRRLLIKAIESIGFRNGVPDVMAVARAGSLVFRIRREIGGAQCPGCSGTGVIDGERCMVCHGTGIECEVCRQGIEGEG